MMRKNNYKYVGLEKGCNVFHLARMILYAYYNDELILIVVHGKQGYGKSTYVAIISAQVYGVVNKVNELVSQTDTNGMSEKQLRKLDIKFLNEIINGEHSFVYDWKTIRRFFVFKPRQFLTISRNVRGKTPCCIVDDAGLWLNSMDYYSPEVKAVGKILEVARTMWGGIIFTCSDQQQIFGKIRNMPHVYTIRITKRSNDPRRIARVFKGWVSEDLKKHGRKTIAMDVYYPEMPGDLKDKSSFYAWYKPEREKLANAGFDELEVALDKLGIE